MIQGVNKMEDVRISTEIRDKKKDFDWEKFVIILYNEDSHIEDFNELLAEIEEDELKELFRYYIKAKLDMAKDRCCYKKICKLIKRYGQWFGKEAYLRLIWELKINNFKKSAFIYELSTINKGYY